MQATNFGGERVSFTIRFFGDNILERLLFIFTIGIGWLIWFAIVAQKGQSPAKQLLGVYIHDYATGKMASAGQVWMREFVGKWVIYLGIGAAIIIATGSVELGEGLSFLYLIGAIVVAFMNDDRRAGWDILAGTVIRYHKGGFQENNEAAAIAESGHFDRRLQEIEMLYSRGLLTNAEYEQKRREILAQI